VLRIVGEIVSHFVCRILKAVGPLLRFQMIPIAQRLPRRSNKTMIGAPVFDPRTGAPGFGIGISPPFGSVKKRLFLTYKNTLKQTIGNDSADIPLRHGRKKKDLRIKPVIREKNGVDVTHPGLYKYGLHKYLPCILYIAREENRRHFFMYFEQTLRIHLEIHERWITKGIPS
jgi:hypothetical protein